MKKYAVKEIAGMFNRTYYCMKGIMKKNNMIEPGRKHGERLYFSADDIQFIADKLNVSNPLTDVNTETAIAETTLRPIDAVIEMNEAAERDKNFKAYLKMRQQFDAMTEKDLQRFFAPMTERFKFKYIISNVKSVQSQTLTCIAKGKLKGLEKYKLSFSAFLELLKFCVDNNCPTDSDEREVNA